MKYFLYANTPIKPVMRFYDHWFEVIDFLKLMHWDKDSEMVEVYQKMDEKEVKDKKYLG